MKGEGSGGMNTRSGGDATERRNHLLTHRRGSRGFTLVELMVVVAILSVLMAIVFPAVTGTKSVSTEGQVGSDASSVQKAVDNFQNKGIKPSFPEQTLTAGYSAEWGIAATVTLTLKDGSTALLNATTAVFPTGTTEARKAIKWNATTDVWQASGAVNTATFVPDFVLKEPQSTDLLGDETKGLTSNTVHEFLWLLKVNEPGSDDASRTVEVFRLSAATIIGTGLEAGEGDTLTYTQVY